MREGGGAVFEHGRRTRLAVTSGGGKRRGGVRERHLGDELKEVGCLSGLLEGACRYVGERLTIAGMQACYVLPPFS